jgi:hypothetical protein
VIGVLIFAGIVGYGIVYSGLADIQLGKGTVSIGQALLGSKAAKAKPSDFPKGNAPVGVPANRPKVGRT